MSNNAFEASKRNFKKAKEKSKIDSELSYCKVMDGERTRDTTVMIHKVDLINPSFCIDT